MSYLFCLFFRPSKGIWTLTESLKSLAGITVATRQFDLPKDPWLSLFEWAGFFVADTGSEGARNLEYVNTPGVYATSTSAVEIGFQREVSIHAGTNCLNFFSGLNRMNRDRN